MNRQTWIKPSFLAVALLAGLGDGIASSAQAGFVISMDNTYNGTAPSGSGPYLRATFEDTATPGTVRLTLENLMSSAGGQQFVDNWLFNVNPAITGGLAFQYVSGVNTVGGTPSFSPNAYGDNQGSGVSGLPKSGLFDVLFNFQASNSGSPGRFSGAAGHNVSVWDISATGLTAGSFNYLSISGGNGDNEFLSVAHVQGIPTNGGTTSGALSGTGSTNQLGAVPEPPGLVLMGVGVALAGWFAVKRRGRPVSPDQPPSKAARPALF